MEPEMMNIADLQPRSREVNVKVKVVNINEEREVISRRDGSTNRVTEALVGDSTGCVYLTLWNEDIDNIKVNSSIEIKNGYCNLFRGNLRLNTGRYGSYEEIEEDIEANTENNLSDKEYPRRPYSPRRSPRGYDRERRPYRDRRRF